MKLRPDFKLNLTKETLSDEMIQEGLQSLLGDMYDKKLLLHRAIVEVYTDEEDMIVINLIIDKGYSEY